MERLDVWLGNFSHILPRIQGEILAKNIFTKNSLTFEDGLKRTCLLPRFSALLMHLSAEARESINTMVAAEKLKKFLLNLKLEICE